MVSVMTSYFQSSYSDTWYLSRLVTFRVAIVMVSVMVIFRVAIVIHGICHVVTFRVAIYSDTWYLS